MEVDTGMGAEMGVDVGTGAGVDVNAGVDVETGAGVCGCGRGCRHGCGSTVEGAYAEAKADSDEEAKTNAWRQA